MQIDTALLVETRSGLRALFGRMLHAAGVRVVLHADSAADALSQLEQADPHGMPPLLVLDLDGMGEDGTALIEYLRTHPDPRIAHLPVLAATHEHSEDAVRRLAALGVDEVLMKPLSLQQFTDSLAAIARRMAPSDRGNETHHRFTELQTARS
jgi:DNA-binding response OmpR family regulator